MRLLEFACVCSETEPLDVLGTLGSKISNNDKRRISMRHACRWIENNSTKITRCDTFSMIGINSTANGNMYNSKAQPISKNTLHAIKITKAI